MESLRLEMTSQITGSKPPCPPSLSLIKVLVSQGSFPRCISSSSTRSVASAPHYTPAFSFSMKQPASQTDRIKQHCTTENQSLPIAWDDRHPALPCLSFPTQLSPTFLSASFRGLFASFAFLPGQDKPLLRRVTSGWSPAGPCMAAMQRGVGTRRGTAAGSGGTRGSVGRAGWNPAGKGSEIGGGDGGGGGSLGGVRPRLVCSCLFSLYICIYIFFSSFIFFIDFFLPAAVPSRSFLSRPSLPFCLVCFLPASFRSPREETKTKPSPTLRSSPTPNAPWGSPTWGGDHRNATPSILLPSPPPCAAWLLVGFGVISRHWRCPSGHGWALQSATSSGLSQRRCYGGGFGAVPMASWGWARWVWAGVGVLL